MLYKTVFYQLTKSPLCRKPERYSKNATYLPFIQKVQRKSHILKSMEAILPLFTRLNKTLKVNEFLTLGLHTRITVKTENSPILLSVD